jgi:Flp pilus assembly protein TadG
MSNPLGTIPSRARGKATSRRRRSAKNRRGATLILVALVSGMLLTFLAVVVDMSRMYNQKNELQTAADAAALAGVISLVRGDTLQVPDSAVAFGGRNQVLQSNITVAPADVICGIWDAPTQTYTGDSPHCGKNENAVTVTTRDSARYIFAGLLGSSKQVTAIARAYAAYVGATNCVKPWAFPYSLLTKLLQPGNPDTLRDLTDLDIANSRTFTPAQLTFQLKSDAPPTGSGNFGSLDVPNPDPNAPNNGGSLYRYNIANCNPTSLGPGDSALTLTGNMVGPTVQGANLFCQPLANNGDCYNTDGTVGIIMKAALWTQATANANGTYWVVIKQIVAFKLMSVTQQAVVTGYFLPITGGGGITLTKTTIQRPILVK